MEKKKTAEVPLSAEESYFRDQAIMDVYYNVKAAINEEIRGRRNIVFRLNKPYYSHGVCHGIRELGDYEIFIDDILAKLPDAFRERKIGVSAISEIQARLDVQFRVDKAYDTSNLPSLGHSNGNIASLALETVVNEYFDEIAREEIKGRDLADAYIYAKERANELEGDLAYGTYFTAFQRISAELMQKIDIEAERIKIASRLKHENGSTGESKPDNMKAKTKRHRDLTIDRAIHLIEAIGGSRLKSADRNKLAEVIAFLTGDDPESIRQRYSALNPDNGKYKGNTESGMKALLEDLKIVDHYFDLIGLRGESQKLADKHGIPFTA